MPKKHHIIAFNKFGILVEYSESKVTSILCDVIYKKVRKMKWHM